MHNFERAKKLRKELVHLHGSERRTFFKTALGSLGIVLIYALVHDQLLVTVAPKHFTEYHPHYFPVKNARALAALFAAMATIGPGLLLGYLFYIVGRLGNFPKLSCNYLLINVTVIILAMEFLAQTLGYIAYKFAMNGRYLLPKSFYPELSPGIVYTQTTQIFCYLFALIFSLIALVNLHLQRRRRVSTNT